MSIFDKDWFNRNDKFVVQDKSISIGWDAESDEYCRFLYSPSVCDQIVRDNGLLLRELHEMLTVLDLEGHVRCIINSQDESYTDGKTIVVSKAVEEPSSFKTLDVIFGSMIHECCHCIYSDFSAVIKPGCHEDEIAKHIQNILEDEIIEEKMSMKHQGYGNFLAASKTHYFSSAIESIADAERLNILDEILTVLLLAVRWPAKLSEYAAKSKNKDILEEVFYDIKKCMMDNDILNPAAHYSVTHKTAKCAVEIVQIIKRFIDDLESEASFSSCAAECMQSKESEMSKYSEQMEKVASSADTKMSEEELKKAIQKAIERFENDEESRQHEKMILNESMLKEARTDIASQKNKQLYEKIRKQSVSLIRQMKSCIIENDRRERLDVMHNMRNGTMEARKIAEAYQGVKNIYDRKRIVKEDIRKPKYALLILIDESGSMYDLNYACSVLAVTIYEAMKDYPSIDLFIYGHGDNVTTYIDHAHKNKYCLSKIRKQMEQDEAVTYAEILKKVHSVTSLPVVAISITDSYYVTDFSKLKDLVNE